jgi:hypothetical protein
LNESLSQRVRFLTLDHPTVEISDQIVCSVCWKDRNNLIDEREWLIWIQKLTDTGGGLNDLGIFVNSSWLYNILLASVSVNFDSIRAIV